MHKHNWTCAARPARQATDQTTKRQMYRTIGVSIAQLPFARLFSLSTFDYPSLFSTRRYFDFSTLLFGSFSWSTCCLSFSCRGSLVYDPRNITGVSSSLIIVAPANSELKIYRIDFMIRICGIRVALIYKFCCNLDWFVFFFFFLQFQTPHYSLSHAIDKENKWHTHVFGIKKKKEKNLLNCLIWFTFGQDSMCLPIRYRGSVKKYQEKSKQTLLAIS